MESKFYNFAVAITVQRLTVTHILKNLRKIFNEFANPKLINLPTGEGNTGLKHYVLATYKLSRSTSCVLLTVNKCSRILSTVVKYFSPVSNCQEMSED